ADATKLPEHLELAIDGKRAGESLAAKDVTLPAGTELSQDPDHVIVAFLGVISEEQLEAQLAAAEEELGAGQAGAEALAEAEAAGETEGSESEKAGEGDGESDASSSETDSE
ncbi:MAG: 50S ribosomal protein L25, partial [Frankiales bacterium]